MDIRCLFQPDFDSFQWESGGKSLFLTLQSAFWCPAPQKCRDKYLSPISKMSLLFQIYSLYILYVYKESKDK